MSSNNSFIRWYYKNCGNANSIYTLYDPRLHSVFKNACPILNCTLLVSLSACWQKYAIKNIYSSVYLLNFASLTGYAHTVKYIRLWLVRVPLLNCEQPAVNSEYSGPLCTRRFVQPCSFGYAWNNNILLGAFWVSNTWGQLHEQIPHVQPVATEVWNLPPSWLGDVACSISRPRVEVRLQGV